MTDFRTLLIAALAAGGFSTAALADNHTLMVGENDGEPGLSMDEFNEGYDASGDYDRFDADGDGMLSREEFNEGMFARHDRDGDGTLNEEETGMLNDVIEAGNSDAPK